MTYAGVRNVINNITIKANITSNDIEKKINSAFHRSANIDSQKVHADVIGSSVILKGKVKSFSEKEDAEDAAWSAPGVLKVENHLEVEELEEFSF
jgi:osmotically-inducible protein OsmY